MNIPAENLCHPESWCILSHESMHDFVERWPKIDVTSPLWDQIFSDYWSSKTPREGYEEDYFRDQMIECICDILVSISLEPLPWELQQQVTWSYVLRRLAEDPGLGRQERAMLVGEHMLRSACVMRCRAEFRNDAPEQLLAKLYGNAIMPQIAACESGASGFLEVYGDAVLQSQMCKRIEATKRLVDWVNHRKINPFPEEEMQARKTWVAERLDSCHEQIQAGELVSPCELPYPDLLVWSLKNKTLEHTENVSFKTSNAATLSLLWYYLLNLDIPNIIPEEEDSTESNPEP